jgi:hypothetical protein
MVMVAVGVVTPPRPPAVLRRQAALPLQLLLLPRERQLTGRVWASTAAALSWAES